MDDLLKLENYGIFKLSLANAARLICVDLWFYGELEANVPQAESYSWDDPGFTNWLARDISRFEVKLADAVLRGKLKTVLLSQDFDECIFLEDTFVDCHELCGWLELHGHERGDAFEGYINEELELSMAVERDVKYRRSLPRGKNNRGQIHHASSLLEKFAEMSGEQIPKDISLCIRNLIAENQELRGLLITPKEKSDPKPEMNLSTRERNSLLKVIVALCKHSEIDLDERGVAQDIANITETTGMAVGYDTIKKFVKDGKELFQ